VRSDNKHNLYRKIKISVTGRAFALARETMRAPKKETRYRLVYLETLQFFLMFPEEIAITLSSMLGAA
jgi:hypothetical protein